MKKVLFVAAFAALAVLSANAQSFKDTFDTNSMGWTEVTGKDGEAVVKEGVMHLEGKKNPSSGLLTGVSRDGSMIVTSCYAPMDVSENFEIKCKAKVKKITENNLVGILIDYMDEYNYMMFCIDEDYAYFYQLREGEVVGYQRNYLKIKEKKNANMEFSIKSTYNKVEFRVNGMLAIDLRFRTLISNGIGFYTYGAQVADFDDLEVIQ